MVCSKSIKTEAIFKILIQMFQLNNLKTREQRKTNYSNQKKITTLGQIEQGKKNNKL